MRYTDFMRFRTIFFDIDETLYPVGSEFVNIFSKRMDQFIDERFAAGELGPAKPDRDQLFKKHGATAKGLALEYGIDTFDFMHYVNDFPIDEYLYPDPTVREMILRIPMDRYLLTNADRFHTNRVLRALNLSDCFDGMIDSIDLFPEIKPSPLAFEFALRITKQADPKECIFVDDKDYNISAAHEIGFFAVQVGPKRLSEKADAQIGRLTDLPKLGLYQELEAANRD